MRALARRARVDTPVRVVRRSRAAPPEAEAVCARVSGETLQESRVPPPNAVVEVRRSGPDLDEPQVHVQAVAGPDHVAEEPTIAVDEVGRRLGHEAHERTGRQQAPGRRRRFRPVALRTEELLRRVDLDQADTRAVRQVDRVPVGRVVDAGELLSGRRAAGARRDDERKGEKSEDRANHLHPPEGTQVHLILRPLQSLNVRARLLVAFLLLATAAVGATVSAAPSGSPTLRQILARPGQDVALVAGTSDYAPGPLRFSFLMLTKAAKAVFRPGARVWIATGLDARPFQESTAVLEPVGVPGETTLDSGVVPKIYVVHLHVPRPGRYWVVAQPVGGMPIQGVQMLDVKSHTATPAVGSKAIPSRTPTIASTHGDFKELTTRHPPDKALLRYSVADSIAKHKPFVLAFATPAFCESRVCGPVVDVVDRVRRDLDDPAIRFIHVEIYKDNNPSHGHNQWVKQWRLPTEPWVFLVGRDGGIKAKFEGAVSAGELAAAVKRYLG
jgi:hypothetical protein